MKEVNKQRRENLDKEKKDTIMMSIGTFIHRGDAGGRIETFIKGNMRTLVGEIWGLILGTHVVIVDMYVVRSLKVELSSMRRVEHLRTKKSQIRL
jgi:hypothetical protein